MLLTADELAARFGMHPVYVRDVLSKRKGFPDAIRIGKSLRWRADEIDDWIDRQRVSPTARRSKRRSAGSKSSGSPGRDARSSAPDQAAREPAPVA